MLFRSPGDGLFIEDFDEEAIAGAYAVVFGVGEEVFGEHAHSMAISSTKSMIGHLLGASGGVEAGIAALVLRDQVIPPTINLDNPDPECDLDYVPHEARRVEVNYALSNSFGFGGTNGALLFKRHED